MNIGADYGPHGNYQGFGKYLILQIQNSSLQEPVSERLGPVPADLQAWAKRASVVTTVGRKREAR